MSDLDTLRRENEELRRLLVQLVQASGELAGGYAALLVHLSDEPDIQERARAVLGLSSARLMTLFADLGVHGPATVN